MPEVYLNTSVTRLTGETPAAIGVIRIWGDEAVAAADSLFIPRIKNRPLSDTTPAQPRLGTFAGDEVVAIIFADEHAGMGLEVEIQCHGSPLVIHKIIGELSEKGVIEASAESFLEAHQIMRLERLALQHMGQASAPKAAALLWQQQQGALRRHLQKILNDLDQNNIEISIDKINQLIASSKWATRLSNGFRVALAGRPNVGKSSLANALAGYERVVVSPTPGTTRDLVAMHLNIGGWPIILIDTAGLRDESPDPLELAGIVMARLEHQQADLLLDLTEATEIDSLQISKNSKHIQILTKSDLVDLHLLQLPPGVIPLSVITNMGLDELMNVMIRRLIPHKYQNDIVSDEAILFDIELARELQMILDQIQTNEIHNAIVQLHQMLLK